MDDVDDVQYADKLTDIVQPVSLNA